MAKIGKVKIYGEIYNWNENSAQRFIERFDAAAQVSESMNVHIHSGGGHVFEGNLIFNHIRKSPIPVTIYIDGIAASMASIIALSGSKIYMSENSYYMSHAPQGVVFGTADDMLKSAKLLQSMEKNICKVYKTRTGKTDEDVKAMITGDNWYDAEECLKMGLIDGIVDAIAPADVTDLFAEPDQKPTAEILYTRYTALTNKENQSNINQKKESMNKASMITKFGLTGVTEESSDAEIESAIEAKLNAEKTVSANLQQKIAEEKTARIKATVAAAVGTKITAQQVATFETIGETSGESALCEALNAIKPVASISSQLQGGAQGAAPANRTDWNLEKWQKEDPRGLEKLPYEEMNALYRAQYGVDAPKQ